MKIETMHIENFRCFKDEKINFNDYTCFVGPNGAGKSTVLNALNVFFRQSKDCKTDFSKLSEEDFHHKNTSQPIRITVTFCDLSADAKNDLSDYVRQDKLIISSEANFDLATGYAAVKQFGNRLGLDAFREFFGAEKRGANVAELKAIYANLQGVYTDLPKPGTKDVMKQALRDYEANNPNNCSLIPSQDEFYGITKGTNRLEKYIQWVFISASKDFTEECEETKGSALGQLLARTVRSKVNFKEKVETLRKKTQNEYEEILAAEQPALSNISQSLENRLSTWAHPGITAQVLWKQDAEKTVKVEEPSAFIQLGEKGFEGELARFGHGLQRSYMLALLQELSTSSDETAPTLIMAIEEPEIYQHPPQAKYLAEILHDLAQNKTQVLICSHNPLFIPGDDFESIRIVRERNTPPESYISRLTYSELSTLLSALGENPLKEKGILAKLYTSLNPIVNEMFFCKKLVLTEGIEDVAYITTYLLLTGKMDEFRKHGCHIVPVNSKSNLIKPLAIAKLLDIPTYTVCDADTYKDQIENVQRRNSEVGQHKKDNRAIIHLCNHTEDNEWPDKSLVHNNLTMWFTELTMVISEEFGAAWQVHKNASDTYYGQPGGLTKNPLAIAKSLELAWKDNLKSKILEDLVERLILFAQSSS